MEITVQWVRTSWTKQSRGGEAAARRNAAPAGFVVPKDRVSAVHVVRMREEGGFQPCESWEALRGVALGLREADGRLRVLPRVDPLFGLPPRPRRPPAVRLLPQQWVRWQLNYRFSSAAGIRDWSYWLDTFNVAYGPADADVFLSAPTVLIDECGPLR
ncbi:hypothetical protein F4556_000687 [Kitasatospora gansuensis]|uniref:Uncharacterized protein n=1 Tax=Kitasatospora gansuensis TaxID=258050 RepID=A0A7W7S7K3_9ACTN|nr:hypothetical protein [Kitasatospora gansuensis]MBB4945152.1 hypothetical protein [Kitasatospora gansuensis]